MPDLYVQSCIILKCKSSVWFLLGYFGSFQRGSSNGSIISKGKIRKFDIIWFYSVAKERHSCKSWSKNYFLKIKVKGISSQK